MENYLEQFDKQLQVLENDSSLTEVEMRNIIDNLYTIGNNLRREEESNRFSYKIFKPFLGCSAVNLLANYIDANVCEFSNVQNVTEQLTLISGAFTMAIGSMAISLKLVNGMIKELGITVPVALHLDHGSYEHALKCIDAGFSSVMFDGSKYSIEENIEKTKEIVKIAAEKGISVEAEVGAIGGEEDGVVGGGEVADVEECKMIASLGVDILAAGIGNIHGKYPANWPGLRFDILEEIGKATDPMPLVLHGGTGIPADMIKKAISLGVSKINVNTECQLSFSAAVRKYIEEGKDLEGKGFDPRKVLAPGVEAIKATVKEKMELFGSVGKAN